MIILEKGGHTKPVATFEEAQKEVNAGWNVYINKTGKKLVKVAKEPAVKKTTKKKGDKKS